MEQITLKIKDRKKLKAFLDFIKTLDYIEISSYNDYDVPVTQQNEVRDRLSKYKKNKIDLLNFEETIIKIEKEI